MLSNWRGLSFAIGVACAALAGCGMQKDNEKALLKKQLSKLDLFGREAKAMAFELKDERSLGSKSLELDWVQARSVVGVDDGEGWLRIRVQDSMIGRVSGQHPCPLFVVEPMGRDDAAPKQATLTLPYAELGGSKGSAPTVVKVFEGGRIAWIAFASADLKESTVSFVADVPGQYIVVPHNLGAEQSKGR